MGPIEGTSLCLRFETMVDQAVEVEGDYQISKRLFILPVVGGENLLEAVHFARTC
jgi:hypothetical protein